MYNLRVLGIDINIKLNNGIYRMDNETAIGKSRLGVLLGKAFTQNEKVFYYNYDDYKKGLRLSNILKDGEYRVVLIDRLDLYINEYNIINDIISYKDSCIFLLDLKNIKGYGEYAEFCSLRMSQMGIEVK